MYAIRVINRETRTFSSELTFRNKRDAEQHYKKAQAHYAGSRRELCLYENDGGTMIPLQSSHGIDNHITSFSYCPDCN